MTADQPEGSELKPISPARVAQEISKLSAMKRNGELTTDLYDQKFARMIQELRARRIEGTRAEIMATLTPLTTSGAVTAQELQRLIQQLGLD